MESFASEAKEQKIKESKRIDEKEELKKKVEDKSVNVISTKDPKGKIECSLDLRLLKRILDRKSHWNNAEIGCHIELNRSPNYYSPDVHTALQFLHL